MRDIGEIHRHRHCERESRLNTVSVSVGAGTDTVTCSPTLLVYIISTVSVQCLYSVGKK